MKIKEGVTAAFDGAGVEETAKLAIPEKPSDARYPRVGEYLLLRVGIELNIQTIDLRQGEEDGQDDGDPPADGPELAPFSADDPVQDQTAGNGKECEGALGHQRCPSEQRARHEMQPKSYRLPAKLPRGRGPGQFIEMIDRPDDQPGEIRFGPDIVVGDDQVSGRYIDQCRQLRYGLPIDGQCQPPGIPGPDAPE